jgi:hypothetical protein
LDPIVVPAPPKSAFNKNRRVSDLLLGQLNHFQHVEKKNGITIAPAIARDIHTEAGAARYITQMTRAIRGSAKPGIAIMPAAKPKKTAPLAGLALAAAAAGSPTGAAKKKAAKKSAKRKPK